MFQRIGAAAYRKDLDNIIQLCDKLGNPQNKLKYIHVAGTNGKGSVTHIIASILQEQGYSVGVYTSPHYKDYRERIKINGKLISKQYVTAFVKKNKAKFEPINASFFEITNAMAFQYFADKKVDYVVLETGMGGRLDSTNIITPLLSVITNISFDHQQFLGDTLAKIAEEKAGIIKQNVPVVIGEWQKETYQVFEEKAKSTSSILRFASKIHKLDNQKDTTAGLHFLWKNKSYTSDLTGQYQFKNIATALCAINGLKDIGVNITEKAIWNGLKKVKENTYFIGRWMVRQQKPLLIFDSAHNEGGLKSLVAQLKQLQFNQLHFVYGTVADKDLSKIFPLLPKKANYYFCKPNIPRGKSEIELHSEAYGAGLQGEAYSSVKRALKSAITKAGMQDVIIVSGSIFVVAEVL
jgi:dihydrofolate synthase/folylpolyglutamate synthase